MQKAKDRDVVAGPLFSPLPFRLLNVVVSTVVLNCIRRSNA